MIIGWFSIHGLFVQHASCISIIHSNQVIINTRLAKYKREYISHKSIIVAIGKRFRNIDKLCSDDKSEVPNYL